MIITIDGPAGSGKSTAARGLARALGIAYLDTGATYRVVTLAALERGLDLADADALAQLARGLDVQFVPAPEGLRVLLEGRDVSDAIRRRDVTENSRYVASPANVRAVLVDLQRRLGAELGSFVTEGRDQGSVVFPQADLKVYLDADPAQRALRRAAEMTARGEAADVQGVLADILKRDASDAGRQTGPLCRPADAVVVDTTGKSIDETLAALRAAVEARA
ncbi:MAG: (d)CMP kinase [Planctomycetota bacterium]|nr:(d)CMP kinase [Planctomycetota bacterium]